MKKVNYPNLNDYDLSAYEELKGDVLYTINGGKVMDQADMYAMQQADAHHDEETKEEILKKYENTETPSSTPPASTQTTPPPTSTTPPATNTTPNTNNPTTSPTTTTEDPKQNPKTSPTSGSSTDGGTTTPTNSGNNSTGGANNYNGRTGNTGNTSQNNKPLSDEERYYQAGLAHVEDYKNTALNNRTIKGNDVSVREMGVTTVNEKGHSHHSGTFGTTTPVREVSGSEPVVQRQPVIVNKNAKGKSFSDKIANALIGLIFPKDRDIGYFKSIDKNKDASSIFNREAGTKYVYKRSSDDKPLIQASLGKREALGIGYSASVGAVLNPNNLWDSGIVLSGGVGIGVEKSVPITKIETIDECLEIASSSVDFTNPTSTAEVEGFSWNTYSSAGLGISYELGKDNIKGIQAGSIGGGVYYEGTIAITPGEIVEGAYNSVVFIMNQILNNSGSGTMGRFIQFDYMELDGK